MNVTSALDDFKWYRRSKRVSEQCALAYRARSTRKKSKWDFGGVCPECIRNSEAREQTNQQPKRQKSATDSNAKCQSWEYYHLSLPDSESKHVPGTRFCRSWGFPARFCSFPIDSKKLNIGVRVKSVFRLSSGSPSKRGGRWRRLGLNGASALTVYFSCASDDVTNAPFLP